MAKDASRKGRVGRFLKIGSLSSMVGASYLKHKIKAVVSTPEKIATSLYNTNVKNAERIAKTFGELKGAVMKVGQMMSLQAGIFPEEFTSILSTLQQDSPPVDFAVMRKQIEEELGGSLETIFSEFDEKAYASASIGQIHRAKLHDGTDIVVKVQYPNVHKMVESDLKNLRMFFRKFMLMRLNMDGLELWEEVRERISEELDYEQEFRHILEFKELFADDDFVVIPDPIPEYSTKRVLTMVFERGLRWNELLSSDLTEDLKNQLSVLLFKTFLKQLFQLKTLHADPNLSNFAFREDGKLILYDFGCVKHFTAEFVENYRLMVKAGLDEDFNQVMYYFKKLGFDWTPENAIDESMIEHVAKILLRPYLHGDTFNFGEATLHVELFDFAKDHFKDEVKFVIPPDIIFLDRVIGGMYGNMMKLRATADWRDILSEAISTPLL